MPYAHEKSGDFYDFFDTIYRESWGTALHHGWYALDRNKVRAAVALADFQNEIVSRLSLEPDMCICDVGCGYGEFAASLVSNGLASSAIGITSSHAQVAYARRLQPSNQGFRLACCDWLNNGLTTSSFDRLVAIESFYHFPPADKPWAIREMARVLCPGGRAVVTLWLRNDHSRWSAFINKCMLAWSPDFGSLVTADDCRSWFNDPPLRLVSFEDVTAHVAPTMSALISKLVSLLVGEPAAFIPILCSPGSALRAGIAAMATYFGYAIGTLQYGIAVVEK